MFIFDFESVFLYSSLQQQCLVELGVTPYDLNSAYQDPKQEPEQQQAKDALPQAPGKIKVSPQTPVMRPRPVPSSIKTDPVTEKLITTPSVSQPSVQVSTAIDYWQQCSAEFITDLKVVFPDVKLSVQALDAFVAQLSEHVFWKIAPKIQAQYVQMESIEQSTIITSPLPNELTLLQKKELWLLLQPHIPQLTTES
jgi:hypothetical protein